MSRSVGDLVRLSKQQIFELSGDGLIAQTGGQIIDHTFEFPQIGGAIYGSLPSIETFLLSPDRTVTATGSNDALNAAWMPAIDTLVASVLTWAEDNDTALVGDAYITVSITPAATVNGEAHFDDDQFDPSAGAGLVAIVGDRAGSSVASQPIPHAQVRPHAALTATDEMKDAFDAGEFGRVDYGANELVVLPQFGQLHSGPGACGGADDVRYLMVLRAATAVAKP